MDELLVSPYLLAVLFFVVAVLYSSVGLGGGSSYTALMAIFGVNFLAIPTVSLILNVIVTSAGSFNFVRKKHARFRLLLPFLASSIPMSYVGGSLQLQREVFYWLLVATLVFVALRIYVWESASLQLTLGKTGRVVLSLIVGSVFGFIGGAVGIGGGIYLVPLIIILGLGTEKEAAACGSLFVWLNSVSGLAARFQHNPVDLSELIPVTVAVLLGGICGSYLGASKLSPRALQRVLGVVVLVAIVLLVRKVVFPPDAGDDGAPHASGTAVVTHGGPVRASPPAAEVGAGRSSPGTASYGAGFRNTPRRLARAQARAAVLFTTRS
jgi:uncharacterized membrane protein YfcA